MKIRRLKLYCRTDDEAAEILHKFQVKESLTIHISKSSNIEKSKKLLVTIEDQCKTLKSLLIGWHRQN